MLHETEHIVGRFLVALAVALAVFTGATQAGAVSLSQAQQATQEAQEAFDIAKAEYDEAQATLDETTIALIEAEERLYAARQMGATAIRSEYKIQQYWKNVGLLDLLLNTDSFNDIVATLEAQNSINRKNTHTITDLATAEAELELAKQNADEALQATREAHEKAHEALSEARLLQEQATQAEAQRAQIAAQQAEQRRAAEQAAAQQTAEQEAQAAEIPAAAEGSEAASQEGSEAPAQQQEESTSEPAPSSDSGSSSTSGGTLSGTSGDHYDASYFRVMGVIYSGGYRYTYYSQRVLPGGGLSIPGRHVDGEGYVCDGAGRICLASNDYPYGTVITVPFGSGVGCVYDSGCDSGTLDVYCDW